MSDRLGYLPEAEQTCDRCGRDPASTTRICTYCERRGGRGVQGLKFRESGESVRIRASVLLEAKDATITALEARIAELEPVVEAAKDVVFKVWDDDSTLTYEEKALLAYVLESAVPGGPRRRA